MKNIVRESGESPEYIVGIGASAGGLIPINDFFEAMVEDSGMAFVIIQHLSPNHKSLMSELLSKHTPMEVYEAKDEMVVERDCIYLIPNQNKMVIEGGKLKLFPKPSEKKPTNTIDVFFESLARDCGKKAVGIILSGTGSDGTSGIESIKKNGGTVIVQDPLTAEFDGMPNYAISSGYADLVLAPEMMPSEMMDLLHESPMLRSMREVSNEDDSLINNILLLIRNTAQHDFSLYKRPTLQRRLAKRMLETNVKSMQDYSRYLAAHPEEIKTLAKEFLINVTKFFRDKDAFDILYTNVLPEIFNGKNAGDLIKVWSVGCSSGEEAYTLAILFYEYMQAHDKLDIVVKIFATDIDPDALEVATRGIYPASALKDVSQERKNNFFIEDGKTYRLLPLIRKMVVFARHDISKDAPYSKIDLLCSRNMLIYMNPILQNNVLQAFHYAIREKGFLMLGPSETLGSLKDSFEEINRKWKIFRCTTKLKSLQRERFGAGVIHQQTTLLQPVLAGRHRNALNHLPEVFYETAMEDGFAGIFIDREMTVKQAVGKFKNYLSFPESSFNFNLLKMVPIDLSMALSLAVRNAIKEDAKVIMRKIKVHERDVTRTVNIIVKPYLSQKEYMQPFLFIILNEEETEPSEKQITNITNNEAAIARIDELERELHTTKENLQALIEQVEAANEELQSSNEEMGASQEELQSTNEELQSLNEELHTVNSEHQQKIKELNEANDDLNNYFNSSDTGQIFIDKRLIIRKFSPAVTKQINVKDVDIGRSIIDISNNFHNLDFINEIKQVMKHGERLEKEVVLNTDRTFLMAINPYVRRDGKIDGVIINFTDITQLKSLTSFIEAIFHASPHAIMAMRGIRDAAYNITGFKYIAVNAEARRTFKAEVDQPIDPTFGSDHDFVNIFRDVVLQNKPIQYDFQDDRTKLWYQVIATKIEDGLLATFTDITERKKSAELLEKGYRDLQMASEQLKHFNRQLERSNFDLMQFASVASHDLKEPLRKIQVYGDMLHHNLQDRINEKDNELLNKIIRSSGRMKSLIDDVLTFSKLSNSDVVYEQVNLNNVIRKISEDLEIIINEKNADVRGILLPTIKGNAGQINQVFQNLISNGLKFNHHKAPSVIVKEEPMTRALSEEFNIPMADYHCLVVQDNGIGFDDAHAEKIFGIFQRLNAAAQFEGTGIGLAICKKIIENHKGFIKAESRPGEGSRFIIIFPKNK